MEYLKRQFQELGFSKDDSQKLSEANCNINKVAYLQEFGLTTSNICTLCKMPDDEFQKQLVNLEYGLPVNFGVSQDTSADLPFDMAQIMNDSLTNAQISKLVANLDTIDPKEISDIMEKSILMKNYLDDGIPIEADAVKKQPFIELGFNDNDSALFVLLDAKPSDAKLFKELMSLLGLGSHSVRQLYTSFKNIAVKFISILTPDQSQQILSLLFQA